MTTNQLTIGTWNILGRRSYGRDRSTTGEVRAILTGRRLDVLSIQEVHFYDGHPDPQLMSELHDAGLPHFAGMPFSPSHLDADAQLGIGVASRFPLSDVSEYRLENPGLTAVVRGADWTLHDKGLVGARVHLDAGRSVVVLALHLFPFFEFGVLDDDELVAHMWDEFWRYATKVGAEGRTVLAGDYNQADRVTAAKEHEAPWEFCATDRATTVTGMSIDDIALNWPGESIQVTVVPTFSDHHLVMATISG
jgi:endonuclease/exonuclease/phosphatase family metal-dependent hydrolase